MSRPYNWGTYKTIGTELKFEVRRLERERMRLWASRRSAFLKIAI